MALPRALVYGLAAVAAAGAGIFVAARLSGPPAVLAVESGVVLAQPRPVGAFALQRDDRQPFTQADLLDRWTLVFPGFTHCPDVCPNTLGILKAVEAQLGPAAERLRVVFLSVDPERDTPDDLARYVRYFSPAFVGVTGPTAELDKLCAYLGLAYAKVPGETAADYTMDHSAALVLINPQAQIAAYFSPPFKADGLAADLRKLLERTS